MNTTLSDFFTYYQTAATAVPYSRLLDMEGVHQAVVSGSLHEPNDIRVLIQALRSDPSSSLKRQLFYMTVTGQYGRNHTKESLVPNSRTGYFVLDFDHVPAEQLQQVRTAWRQLPIVVALFLSPSGKGLKVFVRTEASAAIHTELYYAVGALLTEDYPGVEVDMQAANSIQGCFLSWDEEAYFNPGAEIISAATANELMIRFPIPGRAKTVSTRAELPASWEEQDFVEIEEQDLDITSLPALLTSFFAELHAQGVCWAVGRRHEFLFNLVQLKRYGVTAATLWPALKEHVAGRWTAERTEGKTKAYLEYLFTKYLCLYDLPGADGLADEIQISDYLSEQLDFIVGQVEIHKTVYVDAPTGAGKTTLVLAVAEALGVNADLMMPTRTLVQQQSGDGIATILGDNVLEAVHREATVLAACYPAVHKLKDRGAQLLVIDEAHSLVSDYAWKSEAIQALDRAIPRYRYVIYLSGSMFPLRTEAPSHPHLRFRKLNQPKYQYSLVNLAPGVKERDFFFTSLRPGVLNVLYLNDKGVLKKVQRVLTRKGYKVVLFTRDELDAAESEDARDAHRALVEEDHLVECDVLLTTCLLQAGVNINNTDKPVHITFGIRAGLVDIVQFPARFRRRPPTITLLHAQTIGQLVYLDEPKVREQIETLCRTYGRLESLYRHEVHDEESAKRKRVNEARKDGVIRDSSGKYRVDEFALLNKRLECLDRNARRNKLVLERVLQQHQFVLTGESTGGMGPSEAEGQDYGQVAAQMKEAGKRHWEFIVQAMLDGSEEYVCRFDPSDPIRCALEHRLKFVTAFQEMERVRADPSVLRNSGFRQFGRRIAFLLVEEDKQLAKKLPVQVRYENELFHQLKRQLVCGRMYTQDELRQLVVAIPRLGYTPKTYLTAIKVLFHVRAQYATVEGKTTREGYILEKEISWQDYDRRPSKTAVRSLDYACLAEAA